MADQPLDWVLHDQTKHFLEGLYKICQKILAEGPNYLSHHCHLLPNLYADFLEGKKKT